MSDYIFILPFYILLEKNTTKNPDYQKIKVKSGFYLPAAGLEPARGHPQQILSLPRLPFRHAGECLLTNKEFNSRI